MRAVMELEHGISLSPLNSCARSVDCSTATGNSMSQPSWYVLVSASLPGLATASL